MNRRGFLGAFLALPVAVRLAKYEKPTPAEVVNTSWLRFTFDGRAFYLPVWS